METKENLFEGIKETLQEQLKQMYMDGYNKGAVTTCATLYATFVQAGLEKDNIIMKILTDLASQNGEDNLSALAATLTSKVNKTE